MINIKRRGQFMVATCPICKDEMRLQIPTGPASLLNNLIDNARGTFINRGWHIDNTNTRIVCARCYRPEHPDVKKIEQKYRGFTGVVVSDDAAEQPRGE
jgi:hypothetical protein